MTTEAPSESQIARDIENVLRALLPESWGLRVERELALANGQRADLLVEIEAPGSTSRFVAEIKREATGAQLNRALDQLRAYVDALPDSRPIFAAPWISRSVRARLDAEGISYIDATGNARVVSDRPALVLTARGAEKNPWPGDKSLQSLRGTGAARAVRALVDFTPPYGVRELAVQTLASPATLSRVLDLLEGEGLVERNDGGGVADVDWAGTIRRWAQDYDLLKFNSAVGYLQPRGLNDLTSRLRDGATARALTGSVAANLLAPFAPARLAMIYVDNVREAVEALDLRETESGANVMLLQPFDKVVTARWIQRDGLWLVNPSQLAADLLTSPGRGPAEGEELLAWMKDNLDAWRR